MVWVGNDQNEQTGLYGATGAMRVWSGIFSRLPSAPLKVADKGLDWQWVVGSAQPPTPAARARAGSPFVAGFAPAYQPCAVAEPDPITNSSRKTGRAAAGASWFGWGDRDGRSDPRSNAAQPEPAPPPHG